MVSMPTMAPSTRSTNTLSAKSRVNLLYIHVEYILRQAPVGMAGSMRNRENTADCHASKRNCRKLMVSLVAALTCGGKGVSISRFKARK